MSRFMTIWLPRWPVQRRLREHPEWRTVPVFVCRRERRGVMAELPERVATLTRRKTRRGGRAGRLGTSRAGGDGA